MVHYRNARWMVHDREMFLWLDLREEDAKESPWRGRRRGEDAIHGETLGYTL